MFDAFFKQLCTFANSSDPQVASIAAANSISNYNYNCYCDGFGFGGMPSLYFATNENSTNVFEAGRS